MLQIISRKFFQDGKVNEREQDAILYSNYAWVNSINSSIAQIRAIDHGMSQVPAYVVRYVNRYQPREKDILVMSDGGEAVEQLRLLAVLWFKAFFHEDRDYVENLCSKPTVHNLRAPVPSSFAPMFLYPRKQGDFTQVKEFSNFVDRVLGVPRRDYKLIVLCAAIFVDALEAVKVNFDLAYSMFVYVLEALGKSKDYEPSWLDYDQTARENLEIVFQSIPDSDADQIKEILLHGAQLKLTKRFLEFTIDHVEDRFFVEEAQDIKRPLSYSSLRDALGNLYKSRSGFVHELRGVHDQLRLPGFADSSDIFTWRGATFLTMPGLIRLTHHVLMTFISRRPVLEWETYNWRSELPGIIQAELAPKFWIWRTESFDGSQAKQRFSGIVEQILGPSDTPQIELPDLSPLMECIERLVPQSSPKYRGALLATYFLVNSLVDESRQRPDFRDVLDRYSSDVNKCDIEILTAALILGFQCPWAAAECASAFERYLKLKPREFEVHLPSRIEAAIEAYIANAYLDADQIDSFIEWSKRTKLDLAGDIRMQRYVDVCRSCLSKITYQALIKTFEVVQSPEELSELAIEEARERVRVAAYYRWKSHEDSANCNLDDWKAAKQELSITNELV